MTPPAKCEQCGFSKRYTRQVEGEKLVYQACCKKWMCAVCTKERGCTGNADHKPLPNLVEQVPNGVPPNDGIYSPMTVSEKAYHGDLTSLSSSGARSLINNTPYVFDFERREPREPKGHFDFGHAAHKMVLGQGAQLGILDPVIHGLTADGKPSLKPSSTGLWKATEAKFRADGKTVITKEQLDQAQRMAGKVFEHPLAAKLLENSHAEHSIYWHDDATGARLRCRPDALNDTIRRPFCIDYKTTAGKADDISFGRDAAKYGYLQQHPFYLDGLREIGLEGAAFVFIVQEKKPPYQVNVVELPADAVDLGHRLNRRAIETFAECTARDHWPSYEPIVHTAVIPGYAINQLEDLLA